VKLLLDSHTLIWAVDDVGQLSPTATILLQDPNNDLFLSAASLWEIAIKVSLGKLTLQSAYKQWMSQATADLGLAILPITIAYADIQTTLPRHHGDPFDRLLIAQSQADSLPILSADSQFDAYGITRLW
jgi:PIN domain nuclease of toxin-antitoxin system